MTVGIRVVIEENEGKGLLNILEKKPGHIVVIAAADPRDAVSGRMIQSTDDLRNRFLTAKKVCFRYVGHVNPMIRAPG